MKRPKKFLQAPTLPPSHHVALRKAGFETIMSSHKHITVAMEDGTTREEWLPTLCIGKNPDGSYKTLQWLPVGHPNNAYTFDGWMATSGTSGSGMNETIGRGD
jgi:hypothetical protein